MKQISNLYPALIFVLGMLVYSNNLGNGFTFDDFPLVVENPLVTSGQPGQVFSNPYWPDRPEYGLYRPLTTFSYAMQYLIHGMNAKGFHLANVILHVLNGTLVYWVVFLVLGQASVACIVALTFVLHPVQTEAVNSVVGRSELLAAFWMLMSWIVYIGASRKSGKAQQQLYGVSLLAMFLGCLSKEHAVVLVGMLMAYDYFLLVKGDAPDRMKRFWTQDFKRHIPFVLVAVLFLGIRHGVTGGLFLPAQPALVDNPLAHLSSGGRVLTAVAIAGKYLGLVLFPIHLSADYSYNQIPAVMSAVDYRLWWGLMVCLAGISIVVLSIRGRLVPEWGLGAALMAIPFAPVSNIFFPIGTVMGERLMYLPLLGFCLLVGQACQVLARRWEAVVAGVVVIMLGLCGARTFVRNSDWQNNRTLFSSAVRTVPQSAKAQFNLGNALRDEGKLREALDRYRDALILYPDYVEVHYNLGVVYQGDGKLDWALVAYQKALTADSLHASTLHNCGMLLVRKGDHREAADVFRRLVKVKPNSLDALNNYALALHRAGDHQKAAELYLQVLELDPGHEDAAINLGFLYQEVGYTAETIAVYKRVLEVRQDAYRVAYNLGVMLSRLGSPEKAVEAYRQATEAMDERGAMALFQVGVLSQKMGRLDEARKAVEGFLMRWQGDPKMRVRAERLLRDLSENKN